MNYCSPSDVSEQQILDLRSWPSCVEPFVYRTTLDGQLLSSRLSPSPHEHRGGEPGGGVHRFHHNL